MTSQRLHFDFTTVLPFSKHEMCFLFNFGKFTLISVLRDWLDVHMFVKFDTALCNTDERYILIYLENLYVKAFLPIYQPVIGYAPLSCRLFDWCMERGIDTKEFDVFSMSNSMLQSLRINSLLRSRIYAMIKNIRALTMKSCETIDMLLLSEMIRHCNILEGLTVTESEGVVEVCVVLVKISPPLLTSLNFSGCIDLSEYAIALLLRRCPQIKHLTVSGCYDMGEAFIESVIVWGEYLQSLCMGGCFQITCRFMLLLALHGRRPLEALQSDHCYDIVMRTMCGVVLRGELLSLDLTNCHYRFTDRGVHCIQETCRNLTSLNLSQCRQVTDIGVSQLVQSLPQLTSLNISYIVDVSDHTMVDIGMCCPHLTDLNIGHCYGVTDHGVLALVNRLTAIRATSLHCVYRITDRGLNAILARYPRLVQLHTSWNLHLTNYSLSRIGERCHQLTSLSLAMLGVNNFTVLAILSALHCGLIALDINSNIYITDTALLSLANSRSALTLTTLNASYCEQISNRSLSAMARRCVRLELLEIQGCTSVVDLEGIKDIVLKCNRIKKICAAGITMSVAGFRMLSEMNSSIVEMM